MNTLKFKTNINCGGCIKAVTPHLETIQEINSWNVDTSHPDKILTVITDTLSVEKVKQAVQFAGFKIVPLIEM
jgi:copper chaperone CopZ